MSYFIFNMFEKVVLIKIKTRICAAPAVKGLIVVDEDDLKWAANEKKISYLLNNSTKTPSFRKLSLSSEKQNDALKHHGG